MLYTDRIQNKELAALIRGITPHEKSAFATPILSSGLIEDGPLVFYAGVPSPDGNWNFQEITAFPNGDGFDIQKKTIYSGITFFDALYLCAEKQAMQTKMGKYELTDNAVRTKLHHEKFRPWQDEAKNSGQPLDNIGMPLPAGKGDILVDGTFSSDALDVAQTTKNTPLSKAPPSTNIVLSFPNLPSEQASDRLDELRKQSGIIAKFNHAIDTSSDFLSNGSYNLPEFFIYIDFQKASKAASKLPDGPEKTMIQEFNKLVHATHYLERAADSFAQYKLQLSKTSLLERAEKLARKGLEIMETSAEDTDRVIVNMHRGSFPAKKHFFQTAESNFTTLKYSLHSVSLLELRHEW